MAVTTPEVDERVALAVASLHEFIHPDPEAEAWLRLATDQAAVGARTELPTGQTWVRLAVEADAEHAGEALRELDDLTHPGEQEESWLQFVVSEVAASNEPGTMVELPTGESWMRMVLVVPDPSDSGPHSPSHAIEHQP
jgi:hypothetical protein